MNEGHFDWGVLVPVLIHPTKVAIVEVMRWIDLPLAPRELDLIFDEQFGVSTVSYHMRTLADAGVVEVVRQQPVRGALQSFYSLLPSDIHGPPASCS